MEAAMAKGRELHDARMARLRAFGKDLARGAKSRCELCEASGAKLEIYEVPPEPAEPEMDRCVLLCETCLREVSKPAAFRAGEHWRCLANSVWSERPAVQVLAVRLLRRQAASQAWARETLEDLYLEEAVESWAGEAK